MFKQLLAIVLSCLILLSATACSGGTEESSVPDKNTVTTTTNASTESGEPTDSDVSTELTESGSSTDVTGESTTSTSGQSTNAPTKTNSNTQKTTTTTKKKPAGSKSIVWWTTDLGGAANKHLNNGLNDFETSSGIAVDVYIQSATGGTITSFDDKFIPAMSAGNGPDVVSFNSPSADYAVDLTTKLSEGFWSQFFPVIRDGLKTGGKYYAVPNIVSVNGLLCYSKLDFKNAGLDPNTPPTTIAELDQMAEKLYIANATGDGYEQVGFYPWYWLLLEYPSLLIKPFGGSWTNAEGYPTANSSEVIAALEWMMSYADKYGADKVSNSLGKLVNENNSYGHSVAMIPSFSAGLNAMAKNGDKASEWGISVFPGVDSKHNGLALGTASMSLVKGTDKEAEALKFLEFYATTFQENYYVKYYQDFGSYSPNQAAWKKHLNSMDGFTKMMYENVLTQAKADPQTTTQKKYTTPATYMTLVKNSISKILEGKVEIKAEMDSLQRKIVALTKEK